MNLNVRKMPDRLPVQGGLMAQSWRSMLEWRLERQGESWEDIEAMEVFPGDEDNMYSCKWIVDKPYTWEHIEVMSVDQLLDIRFDDGYGSPCPIQLKAWTKNNVYMSYEYDGSDFIITMPRNPPKKKEQHKTYRYYKRGE